MNASMNRNLNTRKEVERPIIWMLLGFQMLESMFKRINPSSRIMICYSDTINALSHIIEQPICWRNLFIFGLFRSFTIII